MPDDVRCERCSSLLPTGASAHCPACLLDFGVHGYAEDSRDPGTGATTATAIHSKEFGDYELIEEIARGGMGIVCRARQKSLNRIVAVKLILAGQWAGPAHIQRFKAEAEAAARLDHPHIVPIHDIGEHAGQHFFSMKLIEGRNLAQVLAARETQGGTLHREREWAQLVATMARAVHYAHQRRVLHRDLKPTNILIDAHGEPHLTDFGLAKIIERTSDLTHTAAILGTPNYMAPEQASGKTRHVTTAADIYSLGAILYELLTGRPPFVGETPLETLNLVRDAEPSPPRAIQPRISRDLEIICLHCLHKEPDRRYGSAEALADELDRFLRDEPIHARPSGPLEKIWRWARRQPALAGLSAALLLALLVGLAATTWQWRRANESNILQQQVNQQLHDTNVFLRLQRAHDRLAQDEFLDALPVLAHILRGNPSNRLAAEMFVGYLASQRLIPLPEHWQKHTNEHQGVLFSPDGSRLASWSQTHGSLAIYPVEDSILGRESFRITPGGNFSAIGFSFDGRSLFAGLETGVVHWLDAISGRTLSVPIDMGRPLRAAVLVEGGRRLLTVSKSGRLQAWETNGAHETRAELGNLTSTAGFSPDGSRFAALGRDGSLCAWETASGRLLVTFPTPANTHGVMWDPTSRYFAVASDAPGLHVLAADSNLTSAARSEGWRNAHPVDAVAFSGDGTLVASAHADRTLRIWHLSDGSSAASTIRLKARQRRIAFAENDHWLLGLDDNGACNAWDARSGLPVAARLSREWRMHGWAVHAGQQLMASATYGGDIFLMELEPRVPRHTVLQHGSMLHSAEFSRDGNFVATTGADGVVRVWNTASGEKAFGPLAHPRAVTRCAFSPDGKPLLTVCEDNTARVWDFRLAREVTPQLRHQDSVETATFSPDGRTIVTASRDGTARLWNTTGEPVGPPLKHGKLITQAQFSPDGRLLVTAGHALKTQLWSVPDGQIVVELPTLAAVSALQFSHHGTRLAIGHFNGTLRIWDVATSKVISPALARRGRISSVTFSPDDRTVLWTASDNQASLWTFADGNSASRLFSHASAVLEARFTPDGLRILTATEDGSIQLWDAGSGFKLATLARHDGAPVSLQVHPNGRQALTTSTDGKAFLHELPIVPLPVPEWLPEVADNITGIRLDVSGTPQLWPHWREPMSRFLTSPPQDAFGQQVWWMVAPRSVRQSRQER